MSLLEIRGLARDANLRAAAARDQAGEVLSQGIIDRVRPILDQLIALGGLENFSLTDDERTRVSRGLVQFAESLTNDDLRAIAGTGK